MKTMSIAFLFPLCALCAFGQTATTVTTGAALSSITMPTYVAGGVAFNQLGTPRFNAFASALVPVSTQIGVYESTTADIVPVSVIDPATKRVVYTFSSQIREGIHKTIYTGSKLQILLGGDIGGAFSTTPSSGMAINLAASVTATVVYQFNSHWAVMAPIRGLYTSSIGGWNIIPELGIVWKPGK